MNIAPFDLARLPLGAAPAYSAVCKDMSNLGASTRRCLAGLVQMRSVNNVAANFVAASTLVQEAVSKGCKIVFLPECFAFIGARAGEAQKIAEPLDGPLMQQYKQLAQEHNVWLSLGGFHESCEGASKIYNTHVVIDETGGIQATYRKLHLFDAPMVGLVESKQALAGDLGVVACDSPAGRLGVTICYDMRFPELYQKLTFVHGAQVLLMPSAFAMKTGEAHWETMLRARAIECQCYVVAAAQAGLHNSDGNQRRSWGHALAIDPWGKIVASFDGERTGVECFEIDLDHVDRVRENMPMHAHRRYDVYGGPPHQKDPRRGAAAEGAEVAELEQGTSSKLLPQVLSRAPLLRAAVPALAALGLAAVVRARAT